MGGNALRDLQIFVLWGLR